MTFAEVVAALGTRPPAIPALRDRYRRLFWGESVDFPIPSTSNPVVRQVRDGDLIKFVQQTPDTVETESVIIPMSGYRTRWVTLCVSSQVGCARGCTFCETAQLGLLRNLSAGEIVAQFVAARREFGVDPRNVVFMGMGEPFDNFEAVIQAVRVLTDPSGISLAKARVSLSTVGRIDGIRRLAALGWRRINLAVSLNAPNDEIRSRIMPINRSDPMPELRRALAEYPLRKCQFIMIEYVLIPDVNDAREHAVQLADYLRPIKCCVNVIPYNPRRDSPWPAPTDDNVRQFIAWLDACGQFVKRRVTRGREFMAACGQLGNPALARRRTPQPAPLIRMAT